MLLKCNPTTKLWGCLISNAIVVEKLSKFLKLVEIAIVMVLGNMEDERTFSMIRFIKSKFYNYLTTHLDLVVRMYAQQFTNWRLSHLVSNPRLGQGQTVLWTLVDD
jgi:hypothetical protein